MEQFSVDPQELLIRVQQRLDAGWVKGKIRGPASEWTGGGQDPVGVCLMGAVEDAITVVFDEQVRLLVPRPADLPEKLYATGISMFCRTAVHKLSPVLNKALLERIQHKYGATYISIPQWNDETRRQKTEVLDIVREALEVVFLEERQAQQLRELGEAQLIPEPSSALVDAALRSIPIAHDAEIVFVPVRRA